jgi:hypothetical protein
MVPSSKPPATISTTPWRSRAGAAESAAATAVGPATVRIAAHCAADIGCSKANPFDGCHRILE